MLYMVIERYLSGPGPVYERAAARGRMLPEGLVYVNSWVTHDLQRCYQVMECDDPRLLQQWMDLWSDIADFEVIPVITSAEAAAEIAPRL